MTLKYNMITVETQSFSIIILKMLSFYYLTLVHVYYYKDLTLTRISCVHTWSRTYLMDITALTNVNSCTIVVMHYNYMWFILVKSKYCVKNNLQFKIIIFNHVTGASNHVSHSVRYYCPLSKGSLLGGEFSQHGKLTPFSLNPPDPLKPTNWLVTSLFDSYKCSSVKTKLDCRATVNDEDKSLHWWRVRWNMASTAVTTKGW